MCGSICCEDVEPAGGGGVGGEADGVQLAPGDRHHQPLQEGKGGL